MFAVQGRHYGAAAVLATLGLPVSNVAVDNAVQEASAEGGTLGRGCIAARGVDLTTVRCAGQLLTVGDRGNQR